MRYDYCREEELSLPLHHEKTLKVPKRIMKYLLTQNVSVEIDTKNPCSQRNKEAPQAKSAYVEGGWSRLGMKEHQEQMSKKTEYLLNTTQNAESFA